MKLLLQLAFQWAARPVLTGTHTDKVILLDYLTIKSATLVNCKLFYCGHSLHVNGLHTVNSHFFFSSRAANTLAVLKAFDGTDLVAGTFPKTICADRAGKFTSIR